MKKLLFLFVAILALTSCDDSQDSTNFYYDTMPIISADVPDEMEVGMTYSITLNYAQPTTCYSFYTIVVDESTEEIEEADDTTITTNVNTLTLINKVELKSDDACEEINQITQATIQVEPQDTNPIILKFWTGVDENEDPIYLDYTIKIIE